MRNFESFLTFSWQYCTIHSENKQQNLKVARMIHVKHVTTHVTLHVTLILNILEKNNGQVTHVVPLF